MDGPPALTLGLEPIRPDLLKHKPTRRNENIISKKMLLRIFVNGIFISVIFMLQHFKNFLGAAVFETVPLSVGMWGKMLLTAFTVIILNEVVKAVKRLFGRK